MRLGGWTRLYLVIVGVTSILPVSFIIGDVYQIMTYESEGMDWKGLLYFSGLWFVFNVGLYVSGLAIKWIYDGFRTTTNNDD